MNAVTVNGAEYHYVDAGNGLPLLFVHGFPLSSAAWKHQIGALQSAHRVIAPDLRGFGDSEATAGAVSMDQYATDLHELLRHLSIASAVVIGHSMGGYIALAFARKFPKAVQGLVLVGTKAGADTPEAAAARRETAEKVMATGTQTVIDAMSPKFFSLAHNNAGETDEVRAIMSAAKPAGVAGALLGMAARPDSTPFLKQIDMPTLVVAGVDDQVISAAESKKMADALPNAKLELIPGAGHLVAMEKPEEFNRILTAWLARFDSAAATTTAR